MFLTTSPRHPVAAGALRLLLIMLIVVSLSTSELGGAQQIQICGDIYWQDADGLADDLSNDCCAISVTDGEVSLGMRRYGSGGELSASWDRTSLGS